MATDTELAASLLKDIMANLSDSAKAEVNAAAQKNAAEVYRIFLGAEAEPATPAHVPAVPVVESAAPSPAASAAPATPAAASPASAGNDLSAILTSLRTLETTFDKKIDEFKKSVVTKEELPGLSGNVLANAIKQSHLTFRVEAQHKAEFNEDLDLDKLNEFIVKQGEAGIRYADVQKAHDAMYAEKRVEARIAKGVADGIKQKNSGATVPGQTQAVALSPAQAVVEKERAKRAAEAGTVLGKTNAMEAAQRLADIVRRRDEGMVQ